MLDAATRLCRVRVGSFLFSTTAQIMAITLKIRLSLTMKIHATRIPSPPRTVDVFVNNSREHLRCLER